MSYPIADYFTVLASPDDVRTTGQSVFDVPASVFSSNAKGQYCLVSLVDGSFRDNDRAQNVIISMSNVLNSNDAILGNFAIVARHNTAYEHIFIENKIKYLIPARPSQITINTFIMVGSDKFALSVDENTYYTFKFEYLSQEDVEQKSKEADYNVAFAPQSSF